jgi:hypothetical protein
MLLVEECKKAPVHTPPPPMVQTAVEASPAPLVSAAHATTSRTAGALVAATLLMALLH